MKINFFIPMQPGPPTVTHQEKQVAVKNGKPVFYEPADLLDARLKLRAYLKDHVPRNGTYCMKGPLRLRTIWIWEKKKISEPKYRITKPDTDNLVKLLKDVMTDLSFWEDDAQVCVEQIEKYWVPENSSKYFPGLYVEIEELEARKE